MLGLSLLGPFYQSKTSPSWDAATHILGYNFHISYTSLEMPSCVSPSESKPYQGDHQD